MVWSKIGSLSIVPLLRRHVVSIYPALFTVDSTNIRVGYEETQLIHAVFKEDYAELEILDNQREILQTSFLHNWESGASFGAGERFMVVSSAYNSSTVVDLKFQVGHC